MKTNKEKNIEYDTKQSERVRPKTPTYSFKELEAVVRAWIQGR
jgi:hypothetical protein